MPSFDPVRMVLILPFLLLGLTFHEFSHAWMANRLGDDTAARQGRLSFNPFRHLDLIGTLVLIFTQFIGWAKPVPVNPNNFRNPIRDMSLVALAGPLANFALAVAFALGFRLGVLEAFSLWLPEFLGAPILQMCVYGFLINLGLTIFNLIPIPPLDGFSVVAFFLPPRVGYEIRRFSQFSFLLLIILLATGLLDRVLGPIFQFFFKFLLGE
jgi:Zn-dependent protease